eukprot:Amastigsp_a842835_72.p1 type:complete len:261 gc:universal Amastigsp_a842835_72:1014-232(-)
MALTDFRPAGPEEPLSAAIEERLVAQPQTAAQLFEVLSKVEKLQPLTLDQLTQHLLGMCADPKSRVFRNTPTHFALFVRRGATISSSEQAQRRQVASSAVLMEGGRSRTQLKTAGIVQDFVDESSLKTMSVLRRSEQWRLCLIPRKGELVTADELKELVTLVKKRKRVRDDRKTVGGTRRQRLLSLALSGELGAARSYLPIEIEETRYAFELESIALCRSRAELQATISDVSIGVAELVSQFARLNTDALRQKLHARVTR